MTDGSRKNLVSFAAIRVFMRSCSASEKCSMMTLIRTEYLKKVLLKFEITHPPLISPFDWAISELPCAENVHVKMSLIYMKMNFEEHFSTKTSKTVTPSNNISYFADVVLPSEGYQGT